MLRGIDISGYQKGIDLAAVNDVNGLDFNIFKATESVSIVDSMCDRFYQAAKRQDVKRGVYHVLTSAASGAKQADWFLSNCEGYILDAMLVLDIEGTSAYYTKDVAVAFDFCERVKQETGVTPVAYMNGNVLNSKGWQPLVDLGCGLWIANYYFGYDQVGFADVNPDEHMSNPSEFGSAAMWQFTSSGRLTGYNGSLDLDLAFMTKDALDLYANPAAADAEGGDDDGEDYDQADGDLSALVGSTIKVRIESVTP